MALVCAASEKSIANVPPETGLEALKVSGQVGKGWKYSLFQKDSF